MRFTSKWARINQLTLGLTLLILLLVFLISIQNDLQLCVLCFLQRIVFFSLLGISLFASIHSPANIKTRWVYSGVLLFLLLCGLLLASRQVWLQHLPPDQLPGACGLQFSYMLQIMPWYKAILTALINSNCANVEWQFWGLSLAMWSLLGFITLFLLQIQQVFVLVKWGNEQNSQKYQ